MLLHAPALLACCQQLPCSLKLPVSPPCCSDPALGRYSFLHWLWLLQQASAQLQQPLCNFLFRPKDGPVFLERPLSSAAIHDRFLFHMHMQRLQAQLWLYQGEATT